MDTGILRCHSELPREGGDVLLYRMHCERELSCYGVNDTRYCEYKKIKERVNLETVCKDEAVSNFIMLFSFFAHFCLLRIRCDS